MNHRNKFDGRTEETAVTLFSSAVFPSLSESFELTFGATDPEKLPGGSGLLVLQPLARHNWMKVTTVLRAAWKVFGRADVWKGFESNEAKEPGTEKIIRGCGCYAGEFQHCQSAKGEEAV